MFYELRQYRIRRGGMKAWVRLMETVIIPFQVSKGMVIVGSFVDQEDPTQYVWMRRFRSEAERVRLYRAVYESETWKNEISPRIGKLLDRKSIRVTRLVPTGRSGIQ